MTIAAEVSDFHLFATATQFMAFTGLIPSEPSSGGAERRGSITKTGNAHQCRLCWRFRQLAQRPAAQRGRGRRGKGAGRVRVGLMTDRMAVA